VEKFQPCDGVLDLWGSAEFKHENTNAKIESKGRTDSCWEELQAGWVIGLGKRPGKHITMTMQILLGELEFVTHTSYFFSCHSLGGQENSALCHLTKSHSSKLII